MARDATLALSKATVGADEHFANWRTTYDACKVESRHADKKSSEVASLEERLALAKTSEGRPTAEQCKLDL